MKILYLITKSEEGGAQTHVSQLARYFVSLGNAVTVMSHPGGWLENEVRRSGIKFVPNVYFVNSYNPIRAIKAMREIKKAVDDFQPDLVHCHSSIAGFLGRLVIRNSTPTIFTSHGWGFNDYVNLPIRYANALAEKVASHWVLKIICVSDFTKKLALEFHIAQEEKFYVIHNGAERMDIEKKNKSAEEPLRIIFVGRFAEPKEPEVLIEAYSGLPLEFKNNSELILIGDGPKRKMLEEIASGNIGGKIIFTGTVQRKEIFKRLAESDIFVLASKWESFGLTALEAMAIGLPVIVSATGGLNELVDEKSGIKVKRGSVLEMKKALESLMPDQGLRDKMGRAAKTRAREKFSLEKMLKETERVYKEVLGKS